MKRKLGFALLVCLIVCACLLPTAFADGGTLQDLQTAVNNNAASYTVLADLEIPADTEVQAWNTVIIIPENVTLTVNGRLTARGFRIAETGTLAVESVARVEFHDDINPPSVSQTVNGSVILAEGASLNTDYGSWNFTNFKDHIQTNMGPDSEKPVIHLSAIINANNTANLQNALDSLKDAVSSHPVDGADFTGTLFAECDCTPSTNIAVPGGIELIIRDLSQDGTGGRMTLPANLRLTVEAGAKLTLRGAPMTVNGTLINDGEIEVAWNMDSKPSSLTLNEGAKVRGSGDIRVRVGDPPSQTPNTLTDHTGKLTKTGEGGGWTFYSRNTPDAASSQLQAAIDAAIARGETEYVLNESVTIKGEVDASGITLVIPVNVTLTAGAGAVLTVSDLDIRQNWEAQTKGSIVVLKDGEMHVTKVIDLSNNLWDEWLNDGSKTRLTYEDGAGFILHRGVSTAGDGYDGLQRAFTDAGNYLAEDDHLHFAVHVYDDTSIDTGDTGITVPDGVTLDITGRLHTNAGMTVEDGGFLLVRENGNLHIDRVLTMKGEAYLAGWSDVSCDYTAGSGSIDLSDNSHMHLHSGDWSKEEASINSGIFQIHDSAVIEPIINVDDAEDFDEVWNTCQSLGEHITGRMRIDYPMTVSADLDAVSPKAVGFEIRGDHGSNGSLTVDAGATFTASFLDLHSANMTVHGKLISTSEVQIQGEDQYPIGGIAFAGDACYESTRSGYLFVRDTENPDSHISGLTMTRFNVSRQGDGWRYTDTGILSFATSAGLRDAIAEGRNFTVTQNTLIDANEIGENAVDASGIKITINSGVTLMVKGKLILGDLKAIFNPEDPYKSGCIMIPNGGELHATRWLDIDNITWTILEQNGSADQVTFEENAGFTLHRGECATDARLFSSTLEDAEHTLARRANGHLRFEFGIPANTWVNMDSAVTIPGGIILDINGGLYTPQTMTVNGWANVDIGGNGNLRVDRALMVNGTVSLAGYGNATCDYTEGSGSIILNGSSRVHMHSGNWAMEQAAIESGIFQFNGENTIVEPIITVNNASEFDSIWSTCQGLGAHINGRMRINYPMTVSSNLDAASPKAVGFEIRGDHGSNGSLTVDAGATFTASFLDLHSANMTVNGELITTSEAQIQGEDGYPIGGIAFAGDACYENQGGYILVRDNENPDSRITGLTMTRFNVSRQGDGWKYTDTGILSFATSAGLRAAIAEGIDFTVAENTLIDANEIGENAVDASGIKITINSGVVLMIRGKLVLGDLKAIFNPSDPYKSGRIIISNGGELHATRWLDIDNMTWTILEQNGSADSVTFEDNAGFTLHRGDCAEDAEVLTFTLEDAERTLSRRAIGHLRFEFGIPSGANVDAGTIDLNIASGITLNIRGTLRASTLVIQRGAKVLLDGGNVEVLNTDPASADLILPSDLTTIGSEAFANGGFDSVYIPAGTTTIAPDAFGEKNDLTVYGSLSSQAYTFAQEKGFVFEAVA